MIGMTPKEMAKARGFRGFTLTDANGADLSHLTNEKITAIRRDEDTFVILMVGDTRVQLDRTN